MNTYTVIINKPDGYNTCKCCVMERWGSDFSIDTNVDESDAIDKIVSAFTKPDEYGEYTAHLIGTVGENEQVVYEFEQYSYPSWKQEPGNSRVLSSNSDELYIEVEEDLKRIDGIIRAGVVKVLDDRKVLTKRQSDEKKEQKRIADERYERQQFEALKQKFDTNK